MFAGAHCYSRSPAVLALAAAMFTQAAASADETGYAPVTAYRPGAADPAELPVPRFLEFELGLNRERGDDRSRSHSVEYLFKYAFTEDSGILLGGEGYVHQDAPGASARDGVGDTELAWKQRFGISETVALGLIAGVQFPTAAHDLGEEGEVYSLIGIYSIDIADVRLDLNAGANRYTEPGLSRWEAEWSAAVGWPLAPEVEAGLDLSGAHREGEPNRSLLLASLGWELHPRLILDAGVSYGLDNEAHDLTLFTGMSVSLGRL